MFFTFASPRYYVLGVFNYRGVSNSWRQNELSLNGIYKIGGNNGNTAENDDGVLIVIDGYQIKIGISSAHFSVRESLTGEWKEL